MSGCPGRLALCGVPCGCEGRNASHYPAVIVLAADPGERWRIPLFLAPPDQPHDPEDTP